MIERLKKIVMDYTELEDIHITRDSVLLQDLGLNSLDLLEMICGVEDEFQIEIPDREVWKLKTVGDVIDYIEKQ